jgi:hypothetical protein
MASEIVRCEERKNPDGSLEAVFIQINVDGPDGTLPHGMWLTPDELDAFKADKVAAKAMWIAKHEPRALKYHASQKVIEAEQRGIELTKETRLAAEAQKTAAEAQILAEQAKKATLDTQLLVEQAKIESAGIKG